VSLTPQDREAFFLAEALHALADCWRHCHHKNAKLFPFAEAIHAHPTRSSRCHHKNGKLFFLPKRSILMLTAGVTVTTKTGSFFLAEAIHAHPTRSSY